MSRQNSAIVGAAGESAVSALFFEHGYQVYAPVFGAPEVDLIADIGGKAVRIQVKTMETATPGIRFSSRNAKKRGYTGKVDWIAFHSTHYGVTAFLKPEEANVDPILWFDNTKPRHRGIKRRYAKDYPIERVIREAME